MGTISTVTQYKYGELLITGAAKCNCGKRVKHFSKTCSSSLERSNTIEKLINDAQDWLDKFRCKCEPVIKQSIPKGLFNEKI